MTEFTSTLALGGSGSLTVDSPSTVPSLAGSGSFVVQGLQIDPLPSGLHHVAKYVGEQNVPQDIKRIRRSTYEVMRRMGTPVIVKKMLTDRDRNLGYADHSPNFDSVYGQTRNEDPLSFGVGFVSKEIHPEEWLSIRGEVFRSETNPGSEFAPAPKYRGFGPGFLTYIVEPDVAEDFYKHTPEGVLVRVQQAMAQAPWWPDINDNDLIIHVTMDASGDVVNTGERYQAKMVDPVSIRGLDRRGRTEYTGDLGNRHVINQTFQMALLPAYHVLYNVETDR